MFSQISRTVSLAVGLAAALSSSPATGQHAILYVQAVKYGSNVTPAQAGELLRAAKRAFSQIPQVRSVRIGRVARTNGPGYEYAVIMEFDSLDDMKAYGESEIHRKWVKEHANIPLEQHLMLSVDTESLEQK